MGYPNLVGGHTALTLIIALTVAPYAAAQPEPPAAEPAAATESQTPEATPVAPPLAEVQPAAPVPFQPVVQPTPPVAPEGDPRVQFGFTLGLTYESESHSDVALAAPVLQGRYAVTPNVLVDADWGMALLLDSQGASSRLGNPWLAGWYRSQSGSDRWAVGVGVTAPLASVTLGPDGRLQRQMYNEALAIWGGWDMWRWTAGRMAAPLQARFASTISTGLDWEAQAAIAPLFGVHGAESGTEIVGQAALSACRILPGARICPRLQAVVLPSTSVDRVQFAGGLRLTADWGNLFADLLINVDEPLGVAGRGTRNWGIQIGKAFAQ
jgi:hypothetical protein